MSMIGNQYEELLDVAGCSLLCGVWRLLLRYIARIIPLCLSRKPPAYYRSAPGIYYLRFKVQTSVFFFADFGKLLIGGLVRCKCVSYISAHSQLLVSSFAGSRRSVSGIWLGTMRHFDIDRVGVFLCSNKNPNLSLALWS